MVMDLMSYCVPACVNFYYTFQIHVTKIEEKSIKSKYKLSKI